MPAFEKPDLWSRIEAGIGAILRGMVGFVTGFLGACFLLGLVGVLPTHREGDISTLDAEQQRRAIRLAVWLAAGSALVVIFFGRTRISRFWLRFAVTMGVVAITPCWPHKDGTLLPFGTLYLHPSPSVWLKPTLLGIHVFIAFAIAAIIWRASLGSKPVNCMPDK